MSFMPSRIWQTLWPGILLLLGLRLAYGLWALPNPDEAYYWLWGQQLDWSYYDHPPFHAWVQGLAAMALGQGCWVLRLPTVLSSGLFLAIYYRLCGHLYGSQQRLAFGVLLGALLASPLYFIYLAMAWQDQWLMVFSLFSAAGLVQFLEQYQASSPRYGQLYGAALGLGLAGLCKYTALFVGLAALGVIVTHTPSLLRRRALYGAIAIALLCQVPILIWNAQHNWLSVAYYVTRSVDSGSAGLRLKPLEVLGFWGLCGLILSPVITWALWRVCRGPILARCPAIYRAMALWLFGVSTGLLSVVALFSTALHYWNILAYLLLLPLLPAFFLQVATPNLPSAPPSSHQPALSLRPAWRHRRLFQIMQGVGIIAALALLVNGSVFPLAALAGPDGDHESRILYGWEQVANAVQTQLAAMPATTQVLTTDYRSAALLSYALRSHAPKQPPDCLENEPCQPAVLAVSTRKDQFDIWAARQSFEDKPVLLLADDWHPITPETAAALPALTRPGDVEIWHRGVFIKTYRLYRSIDM